MATRENDGFREALRRIQEGANKAVGATPPASSHWVTTKEGHHILIDDKTGKITSKGKASEAIKAEVALNKDGKPRKKRGQRRIPVSAEEAKRIKDKLQAQLYRATGGGKKFPIAVAHPQVPRKDLIDLMYVSGVGGYDWMTPGVVPLGDKQDVAAYEYGDFKGKVVLYLHGNGESCTDARWLGQIVNRHKFDTSFIAPDYRGYGKSGGKFTEESCYEVARLAYDHLVRDRHVAPKNIVILGYSLGTGPAAELATKVKNGGLILQAAYSSGQDLLDHFKQHHDSPRIREANDTTSIFRTAEKLGRLNDGRVLMIHGKDDTIVPFWQGKKIFDAIPAKDKRFIAVPNAGHNDFQDAMGQELDSKGKFGPQWDYYAGYRKALREFIHGEKPETAKRKAKTVAVQKPVEEPLPSFLEGEPDIEEDPGFYVNEDAF